MSQTAVGYLDRLDQNGVSTGQPFEILTKQETFIGRNNNLCRVVVDAPWISNQHIRMYSIIYSDDVEPFLYVEDISSQGSNTWLYKRKRQWERIVMSKGSVMLLSDGDRLRLCDGTVFAFRSYQTAQSSMAPTAKDELREQEMDSFNNLFHITKRQLGAGGSATVFMAVDRWNMKQVACKIVGLKPPGSDPTKSPHFRNCDEDCLVGHTADVSTTPYEKGLRQEVAMLKTLSHPNIIRLERVFSSKNTLYLIEDLITGGDLASYIEQEGVLDAEDACGIVYQILQALDYIHSKGIAHRDLKPENVLMSVPTVGARILLTDFGGAGRLKSRPRRLYTFCGTAEWLAPEVSPKPGNGYTLAVDMWSLGCVITALFAGHSIFAEGGEENVRCSTMTIRTAAAKCDLSALNSSPMWQHVNPLAKDLTKGLLLLDQTKRLSTKEALRHDWFRLGHRDIEGFYKTVTAHWEPARRLNKFFEEDLNAFVHDNKNHRVRQRLHLLPISPVDDKQEATARETNILGPIHQRPQQHGARDYFLREAPDEFDFRPPRLSRNLAPRKRKSTVQTDQEDHALRTKAWDDNPGLMSAKDYKLKIVEKRKEATSKV